MGLPRPSAATIRGMWPVVGLIDAQSLFAAAVLAAAQVRVGFGQLCSHYYMACIGSIKGWEVQDESRMYALQRKQGKRSSFHRSRTTTSRPMSWGQGWGLT